MPKLGNPMWVARYCLKFGNYLSMSRLAKKPLSIPSNVEITISGSSVTVKGPKGQLTRVFPHGVVIEKGDGGITVTPQSQDHHLNKFLGLTVALLRNMITGVSQGAEKILEFNGVGFKAAVKDKDLELNLGFSHPVFVKAPEGVEFKVEKNKITISGIDNEVIGQTAAKIREYRKPEPYKGKGIFYKGETIVRKAGKKAATG